MWSNRTGLLYVYLLVYKPGARWDWGEVALCGLWGTILYESCEMYRQPVKAAVTYCG